ncbi:homing endonuclease [Glonium stellatum]|uniref:Homing endonuclease n=1 Tax=Glonium stellatum TaxID=574774 RepID=A0A8E2FEF8_9PEZI|nr:homing endonuclease [Glonium stellatum]
MLEAGNQEKIFTPLIGQGVNFFVKVGFTDGDGTFFISYQNNKYNLRALYFIKKQLGFGSINKDNSKAQFVIRDRKVIETKILPIFDKYPLLTTLPVKSVNDIKDIVSKPWLVGFVEAEGSFYLTSKDSRVVHGFGITQKLDSVVLESIRLILHISTKTKYKSKHNYYILDTTNSRAVENIIEYFHNTMKGNYDKLFYIRAILRKMKKKLVEL